ncbi:SDR family oxidoreductase [Nitriliruptor alkaliphilus]|uniref:SDR family oxidoreductase n=1 Tax=Nitriliruptor alkaliphilus TaxID=427918 RepID=UPI000697574E|nr:NmrA family NAD(P)-binding protein [Nitriliruptor alkaliphilus]
MSFVVHGATGAQGGPVVAALAASGRPVVALTRDADAAVDGARVVVADAASVAELTAAYRDAEGVFVHLPVGAEEDRRGYARNIVAAVGAARPARVVVSTSGFAIDVGDDGEPAGRADSAVGELVGGLADSGVSAAVIAPELFLENLLLPPIAQAVREQGVLRYPLPVGFEVSWASHLDIADVAVALFERSDVTGLVAVGQYPAISGPALAEAFATRFGRSVAYEAMAPEDFGASLVPMIGEGAAAGIAASYTAMAALPDRSITPERSAQKLLDVTPRTPSEWLADLDQ